MAPGFGAFSGVVLALGIVGVAVAVAWLFLPFAMFGTKPLLRELLSEARRTNALLEEAKKRTAG